MQARMTDCENFIEVKKQIGKTKLALCPFHQDTHPSLYLYPAEKGVRRVLEGAGDKW